MGQRYRIEFEASREQGRTPTLLTFSTNETQVAPVRLELGRGVQVLDTDSPRPLANDGWIVVPGGRARVASIGEAMLSSVAHSGWAAPEIEVCLAGVVPGRGQRHPLPRDEGHEIVVGRAGGVGVDVGVEDEYVSRRHLTIVRREDAYIVTNHGTHGATLNGRALLAPTRLQHNDTIAIGTTSVVFRSYDQLLLHLATTEGVQEAAPPAETNSTPPAQSPPSPQTTGLDRIQRTGTSRWVLIMLGALGILLAMLVVVGVRIALR